MDTKTALAAGLVTFAPDDIDWDDEVRIAFEERASMSPDAMTGMEASLRFGGPETMETKIFGRLTAWQNWIFQRPNAVGPRGALTLYGKPRAPRVRLQPHLSRARPCRRVNNERIPNNVHLSDDKRLQRALEEWQPNYINWWKEMGPAGFQADDVFLRTAISVEPDGWANFDYVKMPDYRWGIFLADQVPDRTIGFGDDMGKPVWQQVPGEHRNTLRRLIVTQGDTEPASVEQQRLLGHSCPSVYDLRNLFQVNVEEGRHLWAMVYLLHSYFGRDGREEAEGLLQRRSGDPDKPRMLGAFNEPCTDWLSFFMFTFFTDRDGKFQLLALAESGFDPLVAHHPLHAHRRGAPHVRRRDGHPAGVRAHGPADGPAQEGNAGRRAQARAHRPAHDAEVPRTSGTRCRSTCSAARSAPTPPASSPRASRAARRRSSSRTTWP